MTESFVPVPGGRLFVVDEGAGPPIMLLHAGIADLRSWDAMAPLLAREGYRVIRADRRGFGRAETEAVPFSNRTDTLAVLDSCGVGRAVLVGNSQGGQIAFDTAIEFPDRVVAVVGVGAGLGGFEGNPTEAELAAFEEGDRLESADPIDADAMAEFEVRFWVDGPGQPATRVPSEIREALREMSRWTYDPPRVSGDPIVLDPRAVTRLGELRCPVLAIAGALDVSDVVQTALFLEATAPNARAVVMPDVAHMVGMEKPSELAALIVDFVRPLGSFA